MAARYAGLLSTIAALFAVVAFVVMRADDSACVARRFPAQVLLTKVAEAERGVMKERRRFDNLPLCTPGASQVCYGTYLVLDVTKLDPMGYSIYASTTDTGFVAVAAGTSGDAIGDVLTLDEAGAATATRGFCGRW
jgi:hypothetical protein